MFKIGDKVRGIGDHDFMDIDGYIGVIVARTCKNEPIWLVDFGKAFDGHTGQNAELETATGWNVPESKLELIEDKPNVKIIQNGLVVIASRGKTKGIAKCNPTDKFDLKTGIELALKRLEEKEADGESFVPKEGEKFYTFGFLITNEEGSISTFHCTGHFGDAVAIALGNAFRTREDARRNAGAIKEKMKKVIEYAKTLNTPR